MYSGKIAVPPGGGGIVIRTFFYSFSFCIGICNLLLLFLTENPTNLLQQKINSNPLHGPLTHGKA
jgi:hypothetical protein